MAYADYGLTASELDSLARLCDRDTDALYDELRQRPWALHDILSEPELVEAVLEPKSILETPQPFALFAVLVRLAADELLQSTYVNDWVGPRSRLPVFDVEPIQEFVCAPGRVLFVARLLTSMIAPASLAVPVASSDPWELIDWLNAVDETERVALLRRLGDLSLFLAGVHADAHGAQILSPSRAEKVGHQLGMTSAEILDLVDPASLSPGLDALEDLGARWYREVRKAEPTTAPIVGDIAQRIHAARRFLNHLSDTYLAPFAPLWPKAA